MQRPSTLTGLSIKDEMFAVRLLELARAVAPEGNRVQFARACEVHGIRGFLQRFPDVWQQITDRPEREGIKPNQQFRVENAAFALKLAAVQDQILRQLDSQGVRVLALKGLSLSKLLFGEIADREFGDIDLLVAPDDAARVFQVLQSDGMVKTYPTGLSVSQEQALIRYSKAQCFRVPKGACTLDLHWRLLSAWIGSDIFPFEEIWQRSQVLERQGLSPWRTLSNEDTIVFLALHGYQDGWPKLKQFLDFIVALESLEFDWSRVLQIAGPRAVLVERATELVVRLFGIPHPGTMTYYFVDYDHAYRSWMEMAKATKSPQSKLLRPRCWSCHSSEALFRSLQALLTPAIDDIESINLPSNLIAAYPLVRLARLFQKAITRRGQDE